MLCIMGLICGLCMSPFALVTSGLIKAEEIAGCKFLDMGWIQHVLSTRVPAVFLNGIDFLHELPDMIFKLFGSCIF
jgi:hypothetical protein